MSNNNQIERLLQELTEEYFSLGIDQQIDHTKFYLYSLITHSTAIEGSTVTELENQLLFDEGITAKGKPLIEQMMNLDLKQAYEWGMEQMASHPPITVALLKQLSAQVMTHTGSEYSAMAGFFSAAKGDLRLLNVSAGLGGSSYMNYQKVPQSLEKFCIELNKRRSLIGKEDIVAIYELSFWAHYELVTIHPWADGNGRTSRLLMNLLQMEYGVIPMKVFKEEKAEYIQSLEDSRDNNSPHAFIETMMALHTKHLADEIKRFTATMSEKNVRKELTDRQRDIIRIICSDAQATIAQMSEKTGVNEKTVRRDLQDLQQCGVLMRIGGRKMGKWQLNLQLI